MYQRTLTLPSGTRVDYRLSGKRETLTLSGALSSADLRAFSLSRLRASASPTSDRSRREPLRRPDRTDPDAFYRRVAEAYMAVAVDTAKVAKVLADEAGVPVTTVHRWVLEARRRGHLPPARRKSR